MPHPLHILVSLADQSLQLRADNDVLRRYPVSTSRHGIGYEEGSYKTPLGSFQICEKFGDEAPAHTIFRSRLPDGFWDPGQPSSKDLVLTRILRLEGLDPDNLNTYDRYIYIHGTNHESDLGSPASQGCIRMSNADVIDLYNRTPAGTPVTITDQPS
jgi:L,D-transpeptidase YbiS